VKTISKRNTLANQVKALYPEYVQCKIIELALVGYFVKAHSPLIGLFCA
jgi:hypothetical protein